MLTKAYIQEVLSPHNIRVRIPLYNKIENVEGSTPNNELHTACVCTLPNFITDPKAGDVVIVGFEENDVSHPVILGYLSTSSTKESMVDIVCDNLIVQGDTTLDEYTTIGKVKPENIKCLKDLQLNIKDTFNKHSQNITDIYSKIETVQGYVDANTGTILELQKNLNNTSADLRSKITDVKNSVEAVGTKLTQYMDTHIKISPNKPTLNSVAEGQIYLWIQDN